MSGDVNDQRIAFRYSTHFANKNQRIIIRASIELFEFEINNRNSIPDGVLDLNWVERHDGDTDGKIQKREPRLFSRHDRDLKPRATGQCTMNLM